jgi:hypothetical protein
MIMVRLFSIMAADAIDPVSRATAMVRYCQDEQTIVLDRIEKGKRKLAERNFSDAWRHFGSRIGKLPNAPLGSLNLRVESPPQAPDAELEIPDFRQ